VKRPADERPDTKARAALGELHRDATKPRSAAELDRGLAAVRARVAAERLRRPI